MRILAPIFFGFLLLTSSSDACYWWCCGDEEWAEENGTKKEQFHLATYESRRQGEESLIEGEEDFFVGNVPTSYQNPDPTTSQPQTKELQGGWGKWLWWKF
mgnify:CR=1 FL=1